MDSRHTSKKIRLSSGNAKNYSNYRDLPTNTDPLDDDFGLWGEELEVDDDVMQQIETQGYSQYQMIQDVEKSNSQLTTHQDKVPPGQNVPRDNRRLSNVQSKVPTVQNVAKDNFQRTAIQDKVPIVQNIGSSSRPPSNNNNIPTAKPGVSATPDNVTSLREELLTKTGEVKNLRIRMGNQEKEYQALISDKDNEIAQLKKQLEGTKSEIELQKLEMQSQRSKVKLPTMNTSKAAPNLNSSFHNRFDFVANKNAQKEVKVFNFGKELDKGDILHKLLKSILTSDDPELHSSQQLSTNERNMNYRPDFTSEENDFTSYLKSSFLQLCWCSSFEETRARHLIKLIVARSCELLTRFYQRLSQEELKSHTAKRKSKTITLNRIKDTSELVDSQDLLKHTKLFPSEQGVAVRQTIMTLAKLLEVEISLADMLIENEPTLAPRCSCTSRNGSRSAGVNLPGPSTSKNVADAEPRYAEKMEVDQSSGSGGTNDSVKSGLVFDVVALLHDIVQEVTIREKLSEYEGVLSSILYLFSVLCNRNMNVIYENQCILIRNTIQKMLLGLPGFIVIQYILEFLRSSTQYSFTDSLCCRSAADTFTEKFRHYDFTRETCLLQVLCAYIEMAKKRPCFMNAFTSWILLSTSVPHNVRWMSNKTDSRLCECVLRLEQITIKIMLSCIEQYNDSRTSPADRLLLRSSLKRCLPIFKHFRWQDSEFDLHTATCRDEYKLLLRSLCEIMDDEATRKFISQERDYLDESQKHTLSPETQDGVVRSILDMFSQDDYL